MHHLEYLLCADIVLCPTIVVLKCEVCQKPWREDLLKHTFLDPTVSFQFSRSGIGTKICFSNQFPCDAEAAALGTTSENTYLDKEARDKAIQI